MRESLLFSRDTATPPFLFCRAHEHWRRGLLAGKEKLEGCHLCAHDWTEVWRVGLCMQLNPGLGWAWLGFDSLSCPQGECVNEITHQEANVKK